MDDPEMSNGKDQEPDPPYRASIPKFTLLFLGLPGQIALIVLVIDFFVGLGLSPLVQRVLFAFLFASVLISVSLSWIEWARWAGPRVYDRGYWKKKIDEAMKSSLFWRVLDFLEKSLSTILSVVTLLVALAIVAFIVYALVWPTAP